MAEAPRVVNATVRRFDGFELDIEGASDFPIICAADAHEQLHRVVSDEFRKVLDIPEGVPLTLNIIEE
ncbi:hypothetical protein C7C46_16090 [Streptomyces tateyamensis]|uniref:Uncharacterized protein n=1 Tax=Streptomyces tateyamensis TaxID=565073 RepID=A0A2V4NAJ3_9ACTN|nr:hypothetical protein [Streptomyces tateyamensis]PYC78618.1 hypothetical protein C7C46_16090 [Streptomyces tateyamensis]